jgi:chemotaxis protein MotB
MLIHPRISSRTRCILTIPAAALLAAGLMSIAACAPASRLEEAEHERDLLAANIETLKKQIKDANRTGESLSQDKAVLAEQTKTLGVEKAALEETVSKMQAQDDALGSKVKEQDEEAKRLRSTYDGLVANLKKEVQAGQVQIQQVRDGLRVNVAQDILFDSGSAEIDRNGSDVLRRVATQLRKSPQQILVIGHTDNRPISAALVKRYPSNWELGGARAASVVRLFTDTGLSSRRMLVVSMADLDPVASNTTDAGRAKNRRIEIRLRPITTEM